MEKILISDKELEKAASESLYFTDMLRKLNVGLRGGSYYHIKDRLRRAKIDTSHWLSKSEIAKLNSANSHFSKNKISPDELFILDKEKKRRIKTYQLRRAMIEIGISYSCSECGISKWNGKEICIEVDHINSIYYDNRIENLQFLCPNCHSQKTILEQSKPAENSKRSNLKINNRCLDCLSIVSGKKNKRCKSCSNKQKRVKKIDWPDLDTLKEMLEKTSYVDVGRQLGVSDNAVRKHLIYYSNTSQ